MTDGPHKRQNSGEDRRLLQWHPSFQAALRIEILNGTGELCLEREYNLMEKPLQIDTLVIKRNFECKVKKTIGWIFRKHNIVEYKSPEDYISVNDFYKVMGYACIYQSNTPRILDILPEEITITFVTCRYPRRLCRHLQDHYKVRIVQAHEGIYYVEGLMFPLQIVLIGELPAHDYTWLSRLRRNLDVKRDIKPLVEAYRGKEQNPLYQAVMDLIVRANREQYEEDKEMCDALRELFAEELEEREIRGLEQGREEGIANSIIELLSDLGNIPGETTTVIMSQRDTHILKSWLRLAAKAESIDNFEQQINYTS